MARTFNGSSDLVDFTIGGMSAVAAPFTCMAIVNRGSAGTPQIISSTSSGTTRRSEVKFNNSNQLQWTNPGVVDVPITGITLTNTEGWALVGLSKASGTVVARGHKYLFSGTTHTHANSTATAANPTASTGPIRFGASGASTPVDYFNGDIAVVGWWNRVLSDTEVEALAGSLTAWYSAAPSGLWVLDQQATGQTIVDLTGGGANQSAITGTTVSSSSNPLSYGADVMVPQSLAITSANVAATVSITASGGLRKTQTFDNGTAGVPIDASNSGTSGSAIGTPATQGTGTAVYSSAAALLGAQGCRVTGADNDLYNMPLALNAASTVGSGQIRFTVDSARSPTIGSLNFARFRAASTNVCIFALTTGRVLQLQNRSGTGIRSFNAGSALPNGSYVLNWQVTLGATNTTGTVNAQLVQISGGSFTESYVAPGGTNDLGTAAIVSLQFGKLTASGTADFDLDHVIVEPSTNPLPIEYSGSASVAETATLTASGGATGSADVSTAVAITAAGGLGGSFTGSASVAETVSLSAAGTGQGSATESITASLSATGGASGSANVSPAVSITAVGSLGTSGTASVAETVTLSASGSAIGAAPISESVTLTASGASSGSASRTETVTLTSAGTGSGGASVSTAVTITADGSLAGAGIANRSETVTLTAAGGTSGSASRPIIATITADGVTSGSATRSVSVTITASGGLSFTGAADRPVTAALSAAGGTSGAASVSPTVGVTASGLASSGADLAVGADLTASGYLAATGSANVATNVSLTASGFMDDSEWLGSFTAVIGGGYVATIQPGGYTAELDQSEWLVTIGG